MGGNQMEAMHWAMIIIFISISGIYVLAHQKRALMKMVLEQRATIEDLKRELAELKQNGSAKS